MNYLFSNKFKKISGVIFYLSIPIGLFLLWNDRIQDVFVVNVFSIFSYEWIGSERIVFCLVLFGLIIISTFLVFDINYMYVLVFNLFLIILLFNLILKFRLFKHYNS